MRVQQEMKQYRTMCEPERARAQERKRNTQKIDSEGERNFQINSRDEINVQACK